MEVFWSLVSYRQDVSLHDLLRVPKGRTVVDQRWNSHETTWDNIKEIREAHQELGGQTAQDPAHTQILPAKIPFWKPCRRKKNARLLLPWSLSHTLTWPYNLSLLTRKRGTVLEAPVYCVFPFSGKVIKPLFPSPAWLYLHYFCLALVYREPRFWQHLCRVATKRESTLYLLKYWFLTNTTKTIC